jgi:bacillopeptidase F (M6 metalloprotease family)
MKKKNPPISLSKYFLIVIGTLFLSAGIISGEESTYYYSSTGNNVDSIMYTEVNWQGCTSANLMFDTKYDIGSGDNAYVFFSNDLIHLSAWTYTGTKSDWTTELFMAEDLTEYIGYKYIGFGYKTDNSVFGDGFCVDNIKLYSPDLDRTLLFDSGENGPGMWNLEDGFTFIDEDIPDWCEYYDTNGINGIQKDEAVNAINDYLIYQSIKKEDAIRVLNCYFGV